MADPDYTCFDRLYDDALRRMDKQRRMEWYRLGNTGEPPPSFKAREPWTSWSVVCFVESMFRMFGARTSSLCLVLHCFPSFWLTRGLLPSEVFFPSQGAKFSSEVCQVWRCPQHGLVQELQKNKSKSWTPSISNISEFEWLEWKRPQRAFLLSFPFRHGWHMQNAATLAAEIREVAVTRQGSCQWGIVAPKKVIFQALAPYLHPGLLRHLLRAWVESSDSNRLMRVKSHCSPTLFRGRHCPEESRGQGVFTTRSVWGYKIPKFFPHKISIWRLPIAHRIWRFSPPGQVASFWRVVGGVWETQSWLRWYGKMPRSSM